MLNSEDNAAGLKVLLVPMIQTAFRMPPSFYIIDLYSRVSDLSFTGHNFVHIFLNIVYYTISQMFIFACSKVCEFLFPH